jgi:hypothetical protein
LYGQKAIEFSLEMLMPSFSPTVFSVRKSSRRIRTAAISVLTLTLATTLAMAQPKAAQPAHSNAQALAPIADKDVAANQEELIRLLRLSPTLTSVVARDPSLLSDADYVAKNNPQLAQFLQTHPEIALNPSFYLFSHLGEPGKPDQALEREVWPDLPENRGEASFSERIEGDLAPMLVFLSIAGMLVWLTRLFVENRRWGRIFKLQSEVHGRLIERFGSNQELLTYMETEAGKRFLEASPIPIEFEAQQRMPGAVARVLTPIQIGIVLILLGAGFFLLRNTHHDMHIPMLVLGTLFLMPGIGFILSAGVTWILAGRLGMMPERVSPRLNTIDVRDRQ